MASPFNYEEWLKQGQPKPVPVRQPAQPDDGLPEQAADFPSLKKTARLSYSLPNIAKQGEQILVPSTEEGFDYVMQNYGETGFEASPDASGVNVFKIRDQIIKSDPFFLKGGSPKMLLPAASGFTKTTPDQFKKGQRSSMQQDFYVVPQGDVPGDYWKFNPNDIEKFRSDPSILRAAKYIHSIDPNAGNFDDDPDHYIKQAIQVMRSNVIDQHYGKGIPTAFSSQSTNKQEDKVIPDRLPVGVPGVPMLQFNAPIAPTLVGSGAAAMNSAYDAMIANSMFDFGQAMMGQYDDKQLGDLVAGASGPMKQPRAGGFLGGQEERRSRNPIAAGLFDRANAINGIIASKYSADQLAAMSPEQRRQVGYDAAKEHLRSEATAHLKTAFELNKGKTEGISGFRTKEFYDQDNQTLSKLTQATASSFVPTAAPMLASMFGSIAAGPVGGKAASAAMTYKLSTDAEFLDQVTQWAADNGLDITQDPADVIDAMVKMAEADPEGFSRKMKDMVHHARVAGGLEAGVAFGLNEILDKVHLPEKWSKEGSILKIIMKTGQPGVARRLLVPRAVKVLEDTGKEAVEEYLTEVFVNMGKSADSKIQAGTPAWNAARDSIREMVSSYQEDDPNATPEQLQAKKQLVQGRNDAGMVGAYMSLITRLITGHGNPDTALIQKARSGAAKAIASRSSKPVTEEEIINQLKTMEGATFQQLWEFADEQLMLAGHGTIDDYIEQRLRPLTEEQFNQAFPDPSNSRIGGDSTLLPGQQSIVSPEPITQQGNRQEASAQAQEKFLKEMQKNRQSLEEEAAQYNRNLDLEIEKAYSELLKATRYLRLNPENQGAINAVNEAHDRYISLKNEKRR